MEALQKAMIAVSEFLQAIVTAEYGDVDLDPGLVAEADVDPGADSEAPKIG